MGLFCHPGLATGGHFRVQRAPVLEGGGYFVTSSASEGYSLPLQRTLEALFQPRRPPDALFCPILASRGYFDASAAFFLASVWPPPPPPPATAAATACPDSPDNTPPARGGTRSVQEGLNMRLGGPPRSALERPCQAREPLPPYICYLAQLHLAGGNIDMSEES